MENFFQILVISIIQGVTEFLPISSSAHLNLLSTYFHIEDKLIINVSAHTGSLIAVVFFFKKEIIDFGKNKTLFLKIVLASVPLFLIGYIIIRFNLVENLRSYEVIGWTTLLFGILFYFADKLSLNKI